MVIAISKRKYWLWRAVDQHGIVLDILIQSRRDKKAAKRLMKKLLKKQGCTPRLLITDKLKSYGAAKRDLMPRVEFLSVHEPIANLFHLQRHQKPATDFRADQD